MRVVVLGAGAQGSAVARMLVGKPEITRILLADVRRVRAGDGVRAVKADLSSERELRRVLRSGDLVCCCLPGRLGPAVWRACLRERRAVIDLSYAAPDPLRLDGQARQRGVAIVPDCGAAPGLSNLLAGLAWTQLGSLDRLEIYTGSIPLHPRPPLYHEVAWSLEDMVEEYIRPARLLRRGRFTSVAPFRQTRRVYFGGRALMAFPTDGLRTLLRTAAGIREMVEYTLRWEGHVRQMRRLLRSGRMNRGEVRKLLQRCPKTERDLFLLRVEGRRGRTSVRYDLVAHPKGGYGGLQRVTAATGAVVTRLIAGGELRPVGVAPLETFGISRALVAEVLRMLRDYGVVVRSRAIRRGQEEPLPIHSGA